MTQSKDPDIAALQLAVRKADGVVENHREGLSLALQLKEQLVRRLIAVQHPKITALEHRKLLRAYGIVE